MFVRYQYQYKHLIVLFEIKKNQLLYIILSKNMYGPAQIMAVTAGHKSVQSLPVYQRVDNEEKIRMGQTLSENLVKKSNQTAVIKN
jgi:hypothetical protein